MPSLLRKARTSRPIATSRILSRAPSSACGSCAGIAGADGNARVGKASGNGASPGMASFEARSAARARRETIDPQARSVRRGWRPSRRARLGPFASWLSLLPQPGEVDDPAVEFASGVAQAIQEVSGGRAVGKQVEGGTRADVGAQHDGVEPRDRSLRDGEIGETWLAAGRRRRSWRTSPASAGPVTRTRHGCRAAACG